MSKGIKKIHLVETFVEIVDEVISFLDTLDSFIDVDKEI